MKSEFTANEVRIVETLNGMRRGETGLLDIDTVDGRIQLLFSGTWPEGTEALVHAAATTLGTDFPAVDIFYGSWWGRPPSGKA